MGWYAALSKRAVRVNPRVAVPLGRLHSWVHRASGGRVGNTFITQGAPVLFLTTVGRRSGKTRETPLIYARDGERLVVAASNAGAAPMPAWFLNLSAAGEATVRVGRRSLRVRPRVAEDAERERLWGRLMAAYDGYAEYEDWATREIPVVVLEPLEP